MWPYHAMSLLISPPQVVLVLMVHQTFGADDIGQFGRQQPVISVDDGQTLVLQLNHTGDKTESKPLE